MPFSGSFFFCKWKIFVFNILNYMFLKWYELQNVFMLIKTCVFGNLRSCSILKTNHRFCATPELFSDISGNGCLRDWGINTEWVILFLNLFFSVCVVEQTEILLRNQLFYKECIRITSFSVQSGYSCEKATNQQHKKLHSLFSYKKQVIFHCK